MGFFVFFFTPLRYDAACLLLVYVVYIVVLCFDLRISEFVLRRLSPCCTCLAKGSEKERQPLLAWSHDTSLRVHSRSRTDSGIFQDESGFSHLSLSLHGLNEIPEGGEGTSVEPLSRPFEQMFSSRRLSCLQQSRKACLRCRRAT